MQYEWVKRLREICDEADVPMFFKQLGEKLAREKGYKSRKGCDDSEWPKSWRVRRFPSLPVIQ